MSSATGRTVRPETDDRAVLDAIYANYGTLALLVAQEVGLFAALEGGPHTLSDLARSLALPPRSLDALLTVAAAQGFVTATSSEYTLTPTARSYLLETSPFSIKGMLEFTRATIGLCSPENLKNSVRSARPFGYGQGGEEVFRSHQEHAEQARVFTRAMHAQSAAPASAWPGAIDLSSHHVMLDVGGGSGAHSIGAVRRWPQLRAILFDLAPVCDVADEYVTEAGLRDRISTRAGDIWTDSFPAADLHFYSLVYHDWPPEKCAVLSAKSFESLPIGGRIVIHELLVDDNRDGPLVPALFSVIMLLWTEGRQYSAGELVGLLRHAGFSDIKVERTFGYWGIVTGQKQHS